jgi:hypothetical protein
VPANSGQVAMENFTINLCARKDIFLDFDKLMEIFEDEPDVLAWLRD